MHRVAKLVTAFALAGGVAAAAPSARADEKREAQETPISAEARAHFAAGVALLQDPKAPRYEEAYREFKAAYAASPSYKILGNIGLCAMQIERDEEAIAAYEAYLKEAGPELDTPGREQIERDLLTLKSGLVHVIVSSDPPGVTLVDVRAPVQGQEIRNVYGPLAEPAVLGLRRGHHTLTAKLDGYLDQAWELDALDPTVPPHVFVMQKPAVFGPRFTMERPIPTSAYVAGGLTLALVIGGAITGSLALVEKQQYKTDNTGFSVATAQSDRSTGMTLNAVTDGLFAAAIVGAGFTLYFVLSRPSVERPVVASPRPRLLPAHVIPLAGVTGGGLSADWVF
jgi:tetratricopeptide (TPR) repeat protein